MTTALGRPPRWSKKTDQLLRHVALRCRPGLQSELGQWLEQSARFSAFISNHQDKVRKKLNGADDEDSRLDVRAELLVAYLILAERRFELEFEAYGARQRGPDLTAVYRANQRFNLEVTRLRATGEPGDSGGGLVSAARSPSAGVVIGRELDPSVIRLANVIAGKLRQLPGEVPNALMVVARGLPLTEESLAAAARLLKVHSDRKDDAFFARRGFKDARDFYVRYLRLSGTFILDEATAVPRVIFATNREARQPLPKEVVSALARCLTAAGTARG